MILHVVSIAGSLFVLLGTVLRTWDSLAEADAHGEFAIRTTREEFHRLRLFLTPLGRLTEAHTSDPHLYYLRNAQAWMFLTVGAVSALFLATTRLFFD